MQTLRHFPPSWTSAQVYLFSGNNPLELWTCSLESNPNESWRKIKNFFKSKGQRDYPALHHANKVAKTNADKAQLFAESVERYFGIESDHFDSNHFDEVNKFIEDNRR